MLNVCVHTEAMCAGVKSLKFDMFVWCILTLLIFFLGRLVAGLVAEFLRFFNLDFTLAVFQPESSTVSVDLFVCMQCSLFEVHGNEC